MDDPAERSASRDGSKKGAIAEIGTGLAFRNRVQHPSHRAAAAAISTSYGSRRPFSCALALVLACVTLVAGCAVEPERPARKVEIPVFPPPPEPARFIYERTLTSSADVLEDDASTLERIVTGAVRTGEGLDKPYGVAAYKGRIFVTDTVRRAVAVFDIPGKRFAWIGDDGPGALRLPLGIDVDGRGNVYVADGGTKRVVVFDEGGKYVREIAGADLFVRPSGLAVDGEGTRLYVVDTGGVDSEDHRVRVFELPSGRHLFDIGKRGSNPGEFNLPRDVAVAPNGRIYVVDGANFRVQVFDRDGKFIRVFGEVGRQSGQFARPKEIAIDNAGNAYIVDTAFGNFQIFDPEGRLLLDVGSRSNTAAPAKYMLPSGIAVDGDGRVYFVDQYFR